MENTFWLLFLFIALVWSLISFQKKILLKDLNFFEVGFGNLSIIFVLSLIIYPILFMKGKMNFRRMIEISNYKKFIFLLSASLVFAGGLGMNYLLSKRDATSVIPLLQSGMLFLTLLLGCLIYGETITWRKVLASVLAIGAIITLTSEGK